jgi:hypothetical protein
VPRYYDAVEKHFTAIDESESSRSKAAIMVEAN